MSNLLRKTVGATLVLGAGYLYLIAPRRKGKKAPNRAPFRVSYAHRGLHGAGVPENSMRAFAAAVEAGYGIELDLQLSRDGKVMVFHDYNLDRMTGKNALLTDLDAEELRELRLKCTDEPIPYFQEVLDLVRGRVPLLIELKGESASDMRLCEKVANVLLTYEGPWCIESFNPMQLRWWKKNRPDVVRGQLVTNLTKKKDGTPSKKPVDYLLSAMLLNVFSRPDFIAADGRMKNPSVMLCDKVFGAERFVWTIRGNTARAEFLEKQQYPIFEYAVTDFREDAKEGNDDER
ncbi:MAG: glycerophosphodiester phosphodiesterase [Clostridia bacterium]|nr:glycerophosphodiester phosphodiesterase [Clostridia bacterium]